MDEDDDRLVPLSSSLVQQQIGGRSHLVQECLRFNVTWQVRVFVPVAFQSWRCEADTYRLLQQEHARI